jgi:hypothetical protein
VLDLTDSASLYSGEGITAKLADFALTIVQDRSDVDKLYVADCFSIRYAAPEILRETPLNLAGLKAADVYSMAVTCFEVGLRHVMLMVIDRPNPIFISLVIN